ncbi:MAG: response regulator [Proteobacteria bacterium]|nr:response regulator [Pseudomonadota bacterium]
MNQRTILLVDDELELLAVNRETLEGCGYCVMTAGNGSEALDILSSTPVDLVVTDLRMPKLGGHELLDEMRSRNINAEVMILTGYGTIESAVECIQQGAADYLLKPFDLRQFVTKVENILEQCTLRRRALDGERSELDRVLDLGTALRSQRDLKALVKEFLVQMRETFRPDAMALFFREDFAQGLGRCVAWGPLLREQSRARTWFDAVSERLMSSGSPKLFDSLVMSTGSGSCTVSAMVCPVMDGSGALGAAVIVRDLKHGAYALPSLQMLTVFASQAASAMENLSAQCRLSDMNLEIITSHVCSVEAKDIYTKGHSERVGAFASQLGREIGLPEREVERLSFAGILHDVGKIGVPDSILGKPGPLTEDELLVMRRHPVMGRDILSNIHTLQDVLPIVYHHHERVDGAGYPDGLHGDSIPFMARIVSVADGFEAMTTDRAYQQRRTPEEARRILLAGAGSQWDEHLVRVWCRLMECDKITC